MAQLTFNDTSTKLGLVQEAERRLFNSQYGYISNNTELLMDFTARFNTAKDWYFELQQMSDTRWQGDDRSYTTYPDYTETLVADQSTYPLDKEFTKIHAVFCTDAGGNKYRLRPVDRNDSNSPLEERFETSGKPEFYDKYTDSIVLYPAPASDQVTLSEGLQIYTSRTPNYFVYNDTNVDLGMTSLHHMSIADYACWSFAEDNGMSDKADRLFRKLFDRTSGWEERIKTYYANRDVDDRPRMTVSYKRNLNKLR